MIFIHRCKTTLLLEYLYEYYFPVYQVQYRILQQLPYLYATAALPKLGATSVVTWTTQVGSTLHKTRRKKTLGI